MMSAFPDPVLFVSDDVESLIDIPTARVLNLNINQDRYSAIFPTLNQGHDQDQDNVIIPWYNIYVRTSGSESSFRCTFRIAGTEKQTVCVVRPGRRTMIWQGRIEPTDPWSLSAVEQSGGVYAYDTLMRIPEIARCNPTERIITMPANDKYRGPAKCFFRQDNTIVAKRRNNLQTLLSEQEVERIARASAGVLSSSLEIKMDSFHTTTENSHYIPFTVTFDVEFQHPGNAFDEQESDETFDEDDDIQLYSDHNSTDLEQEGDNDDDADDHHCVAPKNTLSDTMMTTLSSFVTNGFSRRKSKQKYTPVAQDEAV